MCSTSNDDGYGGCVSDVGAWRGEVAPQLSGRVWAVALAHARLAAALRRREGLGAADYAALQHAGTAGSLTVGDLAARIGLSRPAATALVERLVRSGRLVREPDAFDRRRVIVRVGSLPLESAELDALSADVERLARRLAPAERDAVAGFLDDVVEVIERRLRR
jgi:DNA-binding MarR family transcriptional regulator